MIPYPTTQGLDPAQFSLRDALDVAILIEEEARDRYDELAEQLAVHHTPEAAAFFRRMARIEERHRNQLLERRQTRFSGEASRVRREMIFDIEAPEYDEARAFMSVREALEVALRSEIKAHAWFSNALLSVQDPDVRGLFSELAAEELDHQRYVQAELQRHAGEPAGDPGPYGDEPAPQ
ncbi:MAG: ferritin family protein [Planctomycetes bacterium]|nr:ferritin family protein [Planctomycetota bacterium]